MFQTQEQLTAFLTMAQHQPIQDQNYVPQFIGQMQLSQHQAIQAVAPYVANSVWMRVQNNAMTKPSPFSIATYNLLASNGYNNADFKAVVNILLTTLTNLARTNPQVAQNVANAVPQLVETFLSCAIAMMYQKYQQIAVYFPQDVQMKIVQEGNRIAGVLSMPDQQQQMPGNAFANVMGGQQQVGFGQVGMVSTKSNDRPFGGGGGAMQQNNQQPEKIVISDDDDYYTKKNKAKLLKLQEASLPPEQRRATPPPETVQVETRPEARPSPKAVTTLSGSPEGVVIQSQRAGVSLNGPVDHDKAQLFKSNVRGSEIREDAAEPNWDGEWSSPTSAKEFQEMVDAVPSASDSETSRLADEFFDSGNETYPNMSGFPGIQKDGVAKFKDEMIQHFEKGNMAFLELLPFLTYSDLKSANRRWYPSKTQEVIPHYDSRNQQLRFYPILVQDGLMAFAITTKSGEVNEMDYHEHGIGYVPKRNYQIVPEVKEPEVTSTPTPKVFRITTIQNDNLLLDYTYQGAYNNNAARFVRSEADAVDERVVYTQRAMIHQPFGFRSAEALEKALTTYKAIDKAEDLTTVCVLLEQFDEEEEIPVRQYLARLFGKQLTRALKLRIGVEVEIDELNQEGWDFISKYADENFPDNILELFRTSEALIIKEVMRGFLTTLTEELRADLLESFIEAYDGTVDDHVLFVGTVEQIMNVPHLAAELELVENAEGFLIPEKARKLHTMATACMQAAGVENFPMSAHSIITRDGFRIDVGYSLLAVGSIMGTVSRI